MSSILLNGDTSGTLTLTVPAVAGTNTITLPASTGTIITTASTSGIPNTVNWTTVQTSSVSPAVAGTGYPMNTTSGALTVTLPASPTAGNLISIVDYAGTFATNNLTINPNGNKLQGSTTNAILTTNREAVNLVYVDSTQGWLAYADVYSTGNPTPQPYTASYLLIAGGGSGGSGWAGGGGAGGYLTGTFSITPGTIFTASVGGGAAANPGNTQQGSSGNPSTFTGLTTAVGGGFGGGSSPKDGGPGGSGGGAGQDGIGGSGTPGQGNAGRNGINGPVGVSSGGGGGGASALGTAGTPSQGGPGGAGTANSITGTPVTYAGGGGGGAGPGANFGIGGPGGGGNGSISGNAATAATANTGGGGGGAGGWPSYGPSGAGGSGVVILSVPTANYSGTTTGSPTITTSGANTIIKFTTGSGTYTG
jgi:hypothetical protein